MVALLVAMFLYGPSVVDTNEALCEMPMRGLTQQ